MSLTKPVSEIVSESSDPLLAIHSSWERVPIATVANILNGFAFKSSLFTKASGMPLLRIRDVGERRTECFYDGSYERQYIIRKGDLVVGMDGDFKSSRWEGPDALLNQRVCKIALTTRLYNLRFLELVLTGYLDAINENTSSQTVRHLSSRSIADIPVPLPPITEQERIVAKIEELLASVSASRDHLAKVPKILKAFRQSVLENACAEGEDLPLEDVIVDLKYGTAQKCTPARVGTPVLRIPNIGDGSIKLDDLKYARLPAKELAALRLELGDILLIRSNGSVSLVGKSALVSEAEAGFAYAGYLIRLRVDCSRVLPAYLNLALRTQDVRDQIEIPARSTSGVHNINSGEVRKLRINLPQKLEVQKAAVRQVEALFKLADKVEKRLEAATVRADKMSQAILAKAFRGELVPTEAELARKEGREYEPASVLLDRIRTQRQAEAEKPKTSRRGGARRGRPAGSAPRGK
jgi:type I restriction enzyme S subunit